MHSPIAPFGVDINRSSEARPVTNPAFAFFARFFASSREAVAVLLPSDGLNWWRDDPQVQLARSSSWIFTSWLDVALRR